MFSIVRSLASVATALSIAGGAAAAEQTAPAVPDRVPDLTGRHYF
jgi:hypothetical protein